MIPLTGCNIPEGVRAMRSFLATAVLVVTAAVYAHAAKPCEELKDEIAKKIEANGVKTYSLEIVDTDKAKDTEGKVVGSCDGGSKKIVYSKTAAPAAKTDAAPGTKEPSKQ
jgi:hypothetical protein